MSYITARPASIEIKSNWFRLLMYLFGLIGATILCWFAAVGKIGDLTFDGSMYWLVWLGFLFCVFGTVTVLWNLLHAGEVMIHVSSEGVWIKGGRKGTTIPWKLIDNVVRPTGQQKQFLVLKMSDENYRSLNRGTIHSALFQLNKLLGIQGIALNIAGSAVSHEQFESWVIGYWNDWKERQASTGLIGRSGELGLKGKR